MAKLRKKANEPKKDAMLCDVMYFHYGYHVPMSHKEKWQVIQEAGSLSMRTLQKDCEGYMHLQAVCRSRMGKQMICLTLSCPSFPTGQVSLFRDLTLHISRLCHQSPWQLRKPLYGICVLKGRDHLA